MVSNTRWATNYTVAFIIVFMLISLVPDGTLPTWANLLIGGVIGYGARAALVSRLNAQDERKAKL